MSSRHAVVVASRVLCAFLIFWVVSNLIDLPANILELHHHLNALAAGSDVSYNRYWSRYYSLHLEALSLKTVLEMFFAGVFYRCGPRISEFLTGEAAMSDPGTDGPTA